MECINCKMNISNYDFCPHCGTPISEKAKKIEIQKNINIRLETLLKISKLTDDDATLEMIEKIATELKNNQ